MPLASRVTCPPSMDIFSLLSDDSGRWGRGGLFTALEARSAEPRKIYELAGKMEGKKQRRGGEAQWQRGHLKQHTGWVRAHCRLRSASGGLASAAGCPSCVILRQIPLSLFSHSFVADTVTTFPGAVINKDSRCKYAG